MFANSSLPQTWHLITWQSWRGRQNPNFVFLSRAPYSFYFLFLTPVQIYWPSMYMPAYTHPSRIPLSHYTEPLLYTYPSTGWRPTCLLPTYILKNSVILLFNLFSQSLSIFTTFADSSIHVIEWSRKYILFQTSNVKNIEIHLSSGWMINID